MTRFHGFHRVLAALMGLLFVCLTCYFSNSDGSKQELPTDPDPILQQTR